MKRSDYRKLRRLFVALGRSEKQLVRRKGLVQREDLRKDFDKSSICKRSGGLVHEFQREVSAGVFEILRCVDPDEDNDTLSGYSLRHPKSPLYILWKRMINCLVMMVCFVLPALIAFNYSDMPVTIRRRYESGKEFGFTEERAIGNEF